jgi:ABC-type amino acid transport substrate-binding protein
LDQVDLALFSADFVKEPTTYEEAVNCERKKDQNRWKDAINKELKEIKKRGVREFIGEKISQLIVIVSKINGYSK